MLNHLRSVSWVVLLLGVCQVVSADFAGWEQMLVIRQKSPPARATAHDIDADGRDELVVVNTRQSRIEIYEWLPPDERKAADQHQSDKPNELPMAPQLAKIEVPLRQLPLDVLIRDIDGDGKVEMLVLVTAPNRILVCRPDKDGKWVQGDKWDLLPGKLASLRHAILSPAGDPAAAVVLLIGFDEGIQQIELTKGSRAEWLKPRETKGRVAWWLIDVDGDGDEDLLEWTHHTNQTVRWYARGEQGFHPAMVLHKERVAGFVPLSTSFGLPDMIALERVEQGLLRRFVLGVGERSPLGQRQPLPMAGGARAVWSGLLLADQQVLVVKDEKQPRLVVSRLTDAGWVHGRDYPIIAGVRAMAAPAAQPGTLLLWAKDAADLYVSRWDGARLTFPLAMPQSADVEDRRIVALGSVGKVTWWVQRVGKDADLYLWELGQADPRQVRFKAVGSKVDQALWIGGQRLLLRQKHGRDTKLASIDAEGKTQITQPGHIKKAALGEFRLVAEGAQLRAARLANGVLQWLDEALQPTDQVMLPEGRQLADYVALPDGRAWALERGGEHVHLLVPDESGIVRVAESIELGGGTALVDDPVLGLILLGEEQITRLAPGQPQELTDVETVDSNIGRRHASLEDVAVHRIGAVDITGDGNDELILHDDQRHQITVVARTAKGLVALLSWPVFEDKAYPYGYERGQATAEPRMILGVDLDGDQQRDLVLLCHDRLIFYLARGKP